MKVIKGKGVCEGIAFGEIFFYSPQEIQIKKETVVDTVAEQNRFYAAKDKAIEDLENLKNQVSSTVGEENALIFEIHQVMLEDDDFVEHICNTITEQSLNAEYAVSLASEHFAGELAQMEDEYLRERAADIKDISKRLLSILANVKTDSLKFSKPVILAAVDLEPSQTVQLDKKNILAFVTAQGSATSHTAILARAMNIPAVIGLGSALDQSCHGMDAIIDGLDGAVYVQPDKETSAKFKEQAELLSQKQQLLDQLKGAENQTLDGKKVDIFANIGSVDEADAAVANDAGGIGLFRSEFLYMEGNTYPTEQQQFESYKSVAEKMKGKKVVIRTMDIGADKQIAYFGLDKEENPALGYRAIRICLERLELFKTQLRALYRASAFGKIAIMFPMIISIEEIRQIKALIESIKSELQAEKKSFDPHLEIGIMIETPAAVMISDQLAKEVDFFSVGTNDLTQYTLAVDRQNHKLESYYNPHHTAILRMLQIAADNAHRAGIWIGICGELAADTSLTPLFLSLGIDELSVSPNAVLKLRKVVRELNVAQISEKELAQLR